MKKFIVVSIVILFVLLAGGGFLYSSHTTPTRAEGKNLLSIPTLIDSREVGNDIELTLQNTEHEFYPGVASETKGFSQSYLGPTIRLYDGEDTRIRYTNEIGETTTGISVKDDMM